MSWRTVVISKTCKLEYKLNYLVIRDEEVKKIHLSEIAVLIIESTSVALTATLISELIKNKIKLVFCDEKHNPQAELMGYSENHCSSGKIKEQFGWSNNIKAKIWQEIVKHKIFLQSKLLTELGLIDQANLLKEYYLNVEENDNTNREGHAAKVYFNAIFGLDFCRREEHFINSALNYTYSIILSAFNREIVANGYLTQIGIWHKNDYNFFNLSSDLMEPFRIVADKFVLDLKLSKFDIEEKYKILDIVSKQITIKGKNYFLLNAISIYCQSIFNALNNKDVSLIEFNEL